MLALGKQEGCSLAVLINCIRIHTLWTCCLRGFFVIDIAAAAAGGGSAGGGGGSGGVCKIGLL